MVASSFSATAVTRSTVSPYRITTLPSACFAREPELMVRGLPQNSIVADSSMFFLSSISRYFLRPNLSMTFRYLSTFVSLR